MNRLIQHGSELTCIELEVTMNIGNVMTGSCEFTHPNVPVAEAARRMRDLDCGFLPIDDKPMGKLEGVVTDRDVVIRAIAEGKDPAQMEISDCESPNVLYCFENDNLETAARHMAKLQAQRLIVLDNPKNKRLRGVVSLGDIARSDNPDVAKSALEGISASNAKAA